MPFLKIAVTLAVFQSSGISPFSIDCSNKLTNCSVHIAVSVEVCYTLAVYCTVAVLLDFKPTSLL